MTSIRVKTTIITTTVVLFTFALLSLPNGTNAQEEIKPEEGGAGGGNNGTDGNGSEAGGGSGGNGLGPGGIIMNNTGPYKPYRDVSDFKKGLNDWDFTGTFGKFNLATLKEEDRPTPLVPGDEEEDQNVIIIRTSTLPSTLKKTFPPLHNGTFSINYYAKGELDMTIEVVGGNTTKLIFNYTEADGEERKHTDGEWGTDTMALPHLASEGDFEILMSVEHSEAGVWGASMIEVKGLTGPPAPTTTTPAPTTAVPPPNNGTNVTTVAPGQNVTLTTLTPQGNGTVVPTTEGSGEEDMSRLESVAKAVWDAFYVFLALFCACLLALVALIIHGRCKYVGSYPLHRETA